MPPTLQALGTSELADQIEQIKIVLKPMTTDEASKSWTAFQAKFRASACYTGSVVLIEKHCAQPFAAAGLDARCERQRGRVQPNLLPPFPTFFRSPRRYRRPRRVE